jgi:hypothetical protein
VNLDADTSAAVPEWITAVDREPGLTAFMIGPAAGRAGDTAVAARDHAEIATHLADGWAGVHERAVPANDQWARA